MDEQQNEQHDELTRMIEPEAPRMGFGSRLVSIFVSPGELMENVKLYPVIIVPLLLSVLIGFAAIPTSMQWTELYMRELSHISIEMYGVDLSGWTELQAVDFYGDATVAGIVDAVAMVGLAVGAVVTPLLVSLFGTLGLWVLSKIAGGSVKFGQMFSAYMHIYVITALGAFVSTGLGVMTGSILDMTSLAAVLMPGGNMSMPAFNVLTAVSVFSLWSAFLSYVAVKVLNDFSDLKAGIIAAIVFAFGVALYVGTSMFTFIMWDITAGAMGIG